MFDRIPSSLQRVVAWLGAALAFVLAILTWGQSKKRQGATEAKAKAQKEDYDRAQEIRRSVSDHRDERVRSLDDAGYRD